MDDNKILRGVYTLFLGLILALFVGLGTSTFYQAPKMPEYPEVDYSYDGKMSAEQEKAQRDFDKKYSQYDKDNKEYSRNVSVITLAASILMLIIALAIEKKNAVISNGVLLGGLFTLVYSVGRGLMSQDSKYTFIAVTVGVLVALFLGMRHFGSQQNKKPAKKRRK